MGKEKRRSERLFLTQGGGRSRATARKGRGGKKGKKRKRGVRSYSLSSFLIRWTKKKKEKKVEETVCFLIFSIGKEKEREKEVTSFLRFITTAVLGREKEKEGG